MQTLEQKGFLASEEDVAQVTQSVLTAVKDAESGRRSYLKILIASTQSGLGTKPRIRAGKTAKLDEAGVTEQLKALASVHEKFYVIVVKTVSDAISAPPKERAIEINRKSNFARTALYAVRSWVRAGNDITSIGVGTVTKDALEIERKALKPPSGGSLKKRAERESKVLVATLLALADADKGAAIEEIRLTIGQLSDQLIALGVAATKDAALSLSEYRPLKIGKTLFMPTQTQVLRQQARPS